MFDLFILRICNPPRNGCVRKSLYWGFQIPGIAVELFLLRITNIGVDMNAAIEKGQSRPVEGGSGSRPYVLDENAISIANASEERKLS